MSSKRISEPDPFDALLNLETTYEQLGYEEGLKDGKAQAHASAFLFGIEKGFEKFIPMMQLRVRAESWAIQNGVKVRDDATDATVLEPSSGASRLEKHIKTFLALTEPATLSLANTDDAVGDFDERFKRAQSKAKVLERLLGEGSNEGAAGFKDESLQSGNGDIENPRLNPTALSNLMS